VEVIAEELRTRAVHRFESRALILCAGAIQSAKVVLEANRDTDTRLPLLDNPMACLPLFRLPLAGKALDSSDSSLGLLNLVLERDGEKLQGSIYGASGPLRSDVIFNLPLSANAGLSVLKRLAAASGLLMMFYPCDPERGGTLRMGADGVLELRCEGKREYPGLDILLRAVRAMGCAASGAMWQYPSMGAGIHYAGTLPMRQKPVRYQLDSGGRLFGTKRVYVADGAAFPGCPRRT
jgi:choline dehydrogenase-like flavoprotein